MAGLVKYESAVWKSVAFQKTNRSFVLVRPVLVNSCPKNERAVLSPLPSDVVNCFLPYPDFGCLYFFLVFLPFDQEDFEFNNSTVE